MGMALDDARTNLVQTDPAIFMADCVQTSRKSSTNYEPTHATINIVQFYTDISNLGEIRIMYESTVLESSV